MSCYHTCGCAKKFIDMFLKRNATRQANLGKSSTPEDRAEADREWFEDLEWIELLDPEFAKLLRVEQD